MSYNYCVIPIDDVSQYSSYTIWYGTWSAERQDYTWSTTPPSTKTGTWAITASSDQPPGTVTILATGSKDLPPPPLAYASPSLDDLQKTFTMWLDTRSAAL